MSSYSIYLDETGDFQGNESFYAIFGFIWEGDPGLLSTHLKQFCTDLSDWLKKEQKTNDLSAIRCLHTTDNRFLRERLRNHKPETDLLHSRLKDLPLSIIGIYAYKDEVDSDDFLLDELYRKMNLTLLRQITNKIRCIDHEAKITFHIPTRQTVFDVDDNEKKKRFQQNGVWVSTVENAKTGEVDQRVSLNTSEAFIDIARELDIICSVREISYNIIDPDEIDAGYHMNKNPESSSWGYYTADIINFWARTIAILHEKEPETIESEIGGLVKVFLLQPYGKHILLASHAINHSSEEPCQYLETLETLYAIPDPSPRTKYAIRMLEQNNPFADPDLIAIAGKQIDEHYIYESKYSKARALLELTKKLSDHTESIGSMAYCDVIAKLMTCYHHEGKNQEAQELFNTVKETLGNNRIRTMDICNKYQGIYVNTLAFEQGLHFVEAVLESFTPVSSPMKIGGITISGGETSEEAKIIQARTMSSLGAFHAYLKHEDQAEKLFRDAINAFSAINRNINAKITHCHLAILLLDTESLQSEKLLKTLDEYFCSSSSSVKPDPYVPDIWDHWMEMIITNNTDKEGVFNPSSARFDFWVWLKAIVKLPPEVLKAQEGFARILSKHTKHLEILEIREHPAEMIRRYHALFMIRTGNIQYVKKDENVLKEIIHLKGDYGTIPLLCRIGLYDIQKEQNNLTEEEAIELEKGIKKDIDRLYHEIRDGSERDVIESLIDRLYIQEHISIPELKDQLYYEFR